LSPMPTLVCGHKRFQHHNLCPVIYFIDLLVVCTGTTTSGDIWKSTWKQLTACKDAGYNTCPAISLRPGNVSSINEEHKADTNWRAFHDVMNIMLIGRGDGHTLRATDARDLIYGLLSLVDTWGEGQRQVKPDYALNCAQVYTESTLSLLEGGWNDLLRFALMLKSDGNLPSWVPDWSKKVYDKDVPSQMAVKTVKPIVLRDSHVNGKHILILPGRTYGPIKQLGWLQLMETTGAEHMIPVEFLDEEDVVSTVSYVSSLVTKLRQYLLHEEVLDEQLFMLNIALALAEDFGRDSIETVRRLWLEKSGKPGYDPDGCDITGYDRTWNRATSMMKVMCDPEILTTLLRMPIGTRVAPVFEGTPKEEEDKAVQRLSQAWFDFAQSITVYAPFIAGGVCTGVASKTVLDGDILVRFDLDPTAMYIIRSMRDGLWELVSAACVPQQWLDDELPGGETREFQLC
jgi:hypothetical protein